MDMSHVNATEGIILIIYASKSDSFEERKSAFGMMDDAIENDYAIILNSSDRDVWNSYASKLKEICADRGVEYRREDRGSSSFKAYIVGYA